MRTWNTKTYQVLILIYISDVNKQVVSMPNQNNLIRIITYTYKQAYHAVSKLFTNTKSKFFCSFLAAEIAEGLFLKSSDAAEPRALPSLPADYDSSFQFSRVSMKQPVFFSVSRPSHLKCSYSETNYFKYTRGLKEGLLYARLRSKVRMNSVNRTSSL